MGIIGIFCALWAFIWGWMNAGKYGLKNVMLVWTLAMIVGGAGYGMLFAGAIKMAQEQGLEFPPTTIQPIDMPVEVAPIEAPAEAPVEEAAPE